MVYIFFENKTVINLKKNIKMKTLFKPFFLILFILFYQVVIAQNEEKSVSITVSGSGKSLNDARQIALRGAIEQAYGSFISTKTEILNDVIIADEIISVSSGNIKSYEILNESQLTDSLWAVTLKCIVSIDKLSSFVQSKGITIEIQGGLFAVNIKQQLLNEQGEINTITQLVGLLHEPMQKSFDYLIKSSEPKSVDSESKNWVIPLSVTSITNKNIDFCSNYFIKTISAISLSSEEVTSYQNLNKPTYQLIIYHNGDYKTFYLRKQESINTLSAFASQWSFYTILYTIQNGIDEPFNNGSGESNVFDFSVYDRRSKLLTINFLKSGEIAATYSWQDKKTLTQIEQIKGYSIKPLEPLFKFKYGGYVLYEKDGHGLVISITDIGKMDWESAKIACTQLNINGYSDWRLPKKDELDMIYKISQYGFGGFFHNSKLVKASNMGTHQCSNSNIYWSSTALDKNAAYAQCFYDGEIDNFFNLKNEFFVRPVRKF